MGVLTLDRKSARFSVSDMAVNNSSRLRQYSADPFRDAFPIKFNAVTATFQPASDTYLSAVSPVWVGLYATPLPLLRMPTSNKSFRVTPKEFHGISIDRLRCRISLPLGANQPAGDGPDI